MSKKLRELQARKAQHVAAMRALTDGASAAGRDLSDDESTSFDSYKAQLEATNKAIDREQILLDAERACYEAAHLLDGLMRHITRKRHVITYGPAHVVSRRSTDTTQITDGVVVRALEFIAVNACSGIGVPDVVRHVRTSRRLAEIRFRRVLGHTVLEEILRVRLERVCTLLKETNLPIGEIARMCGSDSESHLGTLFRRRFACTMRDFRRTR